MEFFRNLWLAVMSILAAVGIALVAAAITAAAQPHSESSLWTQPAMKVAYGFFVLAAYVLAALCYDLPLPGRTRRKKALRRVVEQVDAGSDIHRRSLANEDAAVITNAYDVWVTETSGVLSEVAPEAASDFNRSRDVEAVNFVGVSQSNARIAQLIGSQMDVLRRTIDWLR